MQPARHAEGVLAADRDERVEAEVGEGADALLAAALGLEGVGAELPRIVPPRVRIAAHDVAVRGWVSRCEQARASRRAGRRARARRPAPARTAARITAFRPGQSPPAREDADAHTAGTYREARSRGGVNARWTSAVASAPSTAHAAGADDAAAANAVRSWTTRSRSRRRAAARRRRPRRRPRPRPPRRRAAPRAARAPAGGPRSPARASTKRRHHQRRPRHDDQVGAHDLAGAVPVEGDHGDAHAAA